jgi:hypothetical protein
VAVEVTCTLVETKNESRLIASEINELPPGFAIQRKSPHAAETNLQASAKLAADTAPEAAVQ